ncbi:uncharacterized protein C5orf46 homolog [Macrotis lagotis]|uniref:uncharacterized protein C5orf46 homolog n=1 Tax=Macrotis lagotis TaxID=92651 RepID=UPI003D68B703
MGASAHHMMMVIGLLTLILPSHAGEKSSDSDENSGKDVPSILNYLGIEIIDSAVNYVLRSMFQKSGFTEEEEKSKKDE